MGIIGKTHGVKSDRKAIDIASKTNEKKPFSISALRFISFESATTTGAAIISVRFSRVGPEPTSIGTINFSTLGG